MERNRGAVERIIKTGNALSFAAQTSGAVAERDETLQAAIAGWQVATADLAAASEPDRETVHTYSGPEGEDGLTDISVTTLPAKRRRALVRNLQWALINISDDETEDAQAELRKTIHALVAPRNDGEPLRVNPDLVGGLVRALCLLDPDVVDGDHDARPLIEAAIAELDAGQTVDWPERCRK